MFKTGVTESPNANSRREKNTDITLKEFIMNTIVVKTAGSLNTTVEVESNTTFANVLREANISSSGKSLVFNGEAVDLDDEVETDGVLRVSKNVVGA